MHCVSKLYGCGCRLCCDCNVCNKEKKIKETKEIIKELTDGIDVIKYDDDDDDDDDDSFSGCNSSSELLPTDIINNCVYLMRLSVIIKEYENISTSSIDRESIQDIDTFIESCTVNMLVIY